jgi:CubicO group peptidase (beta-lactamase class C family)
LLKFSKNSYTAKIIAKIKLACFLALFTCISTLAQAEVGLQHRTVEDIKLELIEYTKKARQEWQAPGIVIGIVENGVLTFINDGLLAACKKDEVTQDTIFCIMSCSKIVTVCIIQKLVDEGKISLDDKVVDYLPWFKLKDDAVTQQVKVRHLISHCIGLPPFSGDSIWHLDFSQKEIIEKLAQIRMKNEVGVKFGYQNICVGIAGMLVEKITGKPIHVVAKEYIFDPLDMQRSSIGVHFSSIWQKVVHFFKKDKRHTGLASGHKLRNGKVVAVDSVYQYVFGGTSGVNSCTSDYIKLIACLANRGIIEFGPNKGTRLLSERAWQAISSKNIGIPSVRKDNIQFPIKRMNPDSFYYGNGMYGMQYGADGRYINIFSHQGAGTGWRSIWICVPDYKFGFVIFSNYGSNSSNLVTEALAYKILDMYLGVHNRDWSVSILKKINRIRKSYERQYDCFVKGPMPKSITGEYQSSFYGAASIKKKSECIYFCYRGKTVPLKHIGGVVFAVDKEPLSENYCDDDSCNLHFVLDAKGEISGFEISLFREGEKTFKKVS